MKNFLTIVSLLAVTMTSQANESQTELSAGRSLQCVTSIEFSKQGHGDLITKLQVKLNELIQNIESDANTQISSLSAPDIQINEVSAAGYIFGSACVTISIENLIRSRPR